MTSHMVADTSLEHLHGGGAQFVEIAGSLKPQIHKGFTERPVRRNSGSAMESAYVRNCVGRCSQLHSECDYEECVVAIHVPPIKVTAQVKFKVLDGTEPTLSMPMLVANGNRVVPRGEDAALITAKGETAPLMNAGNDGYFKVLINNSDKFLRIDVWTPCHVCPPSWDRNLNAEIVREQAARKDYENSRKSMQSTGTWEMEVLRSLSNPEEMDDVELLKDLSSLGKPPSFDGKDTMLINTAVDTRETSILESSGQKYRKEILPLREQVLARRPGARVNEHHRAIREMDNQVNQYIEMPQIQYTDKDADDSVAVQRQVSPRTTETKHRIFTVNIFKQRFFLAH